MFAHIKKLSRIVIAGDIALDTAKRSLCLYVAVLCYIHVSKALDFTIDVSNSVDILYSDISCLGTYAKFFSWKYRDKRQR